jgi:integrase
LIVVLWRAGLRIGEAMALTEPNFDPSRGSILVRQGKGGKRRDVGMDNWASINSGRGSRAGSRCRSGRCSA